MSAGTSGRGTPEESDDPFAYLYRPEGDEPPAQAHQAMRQPSYNQVRPVGERTYGGRQGYRQPQAPPQPDARYAAPETQTSGMPPYRGGGPGDRRRAPDPADQRRNGLLIGAIAVVLAVVLGVGAAILFSGEENQAGGGDPTSEPTGNADNEPDDEEPTDPPSDGPTDPAELPVADLTQLQFGGGAGLESTFTGARSESGSYIAVQNRQGATVTWTFDFQGDPGQYYFFTGYSTVTDGQGMGFSVNGTPRTDPVNMEDFMDTSDVFDESWVRTYNLVDLVQGTNTITLTCDRPCDVAIDQLWISDSEEG
ncbi:carbohydrate-binding protein [Streptomyces sp. URMC 129]|uniref:carbohydrate-binding protein n=1 Tax=Streptomyces sp. URMC 129 TaxID=3423407 RepID=UPI003F1BE90C